MNIGQLGSGSPSPMSGGAAATPQTERAAVPFTKVVQQILGDANAQQIQADQMVQRLATGQVDNLHEVLLAVAKADLSIRTVLEVRNRMTEAYQEIMRMQV